MTEPNIFSAELPSGEMFTEELFPGMEESSGDILKKVLNDTAATDFDRFTVEDVRAALAARSRARSDFAALLSPAADEILEEVARAAQEETRRHFGNSVMLFTPLYISNYCENACVYCGFNRSSDTLRARLELGEIERELEAIAKSGLREILLLCGEDSERADLEYVASACRAAKEYFPVVGMEIYPVNTSDYAALRQSGADFVTVFQETYNPARYKELHPFGRKRVFSYRFGAQERAIKGGVRGVALAALGGLSEFLPDAFAAGLHAFELSRKYPHAEISFSCPRLRPAKGARLEGGFSVSEREVFRQILAYRLFMPFAGITVSTRESAVFRDKAVGVAATKLSAGVDVGIGGHSNKGRKGGEQFSISDPRSLDEICEALAERGLQPVMSDYSYL